jgi:hypothetical protein
VDRLAFVAQLGSGMRDDRSLKVIAVGPVSRLHLGRPESKLCCVRAKPQAKSSKYLSDDE